MKFIHAADLHLGSVIGLPAFGKVEPALLLWRAFDKLITACIENEVDFLILAGDTFDTHRISQVTRRRFMDGIEHLRAREIKTFLIHGNHDPNTVELEFLKKIDGLKVFTADKAETHELPDLGVALHGQSFVKGPINTNLALEYPTVTAGFYNIGILHTSLTVDGQHARYAPCSLADLIGKNYDYWALGHVHTAQVFSEKPWVGYSGNVQGRHVREEGAKGANLVRVEQGQTFVEAFDLSSMEFRTLRVEVAPDETLESVAGLCANAIDVATLVETAFRVELFGSAQVLSRLIQSEEDLREGIQQDSAQIQQGKALLKDLKFRLEKGNQKIVLPFELDLNVDRDIFADLSKILASKGLETPDLETEELTAFVYSGLGQDTSDNDGSN